MIAILDYGLGNLFSIYNALKKVGCKVKIVSKASELFNIEPSGIVIPGVGAFGKGIRKFNKFKSTIFKFSTSNTPILGICLGMQILFEFSEESGCKGLGLLKGKVASLPLKPDLTIPHMGWNYFKSMKNNAILNGIRKGDYFYFAHSYYCIPEEKGIVIATTEYGKEIAAAVNKNSLYGVQFHPEKSGRKGLKILKNFVGLCKC